jgi:hypothetical protein
MFRHDYECQRRFAPTLFTFVGTLHSHHWNTQYFWDRPTFRGK